MDNEIRIKKSRLNAKDYYDYERLCLAGLGLLDCEYREEGEDLCFVYQMEGKKPLGEILDEPKEKAYQMLMNFAKLEAVYMQYQISFTMENLYYDDNYLVYVRDRDLYAAGTAGSKEEFLDIYKSFTGGILSRKYSVEQILESGLSVLKAEEGFQSIYRCDSTEDVRRELIRRKEGLEALTRRTKRMVSKRGFHAWRITAVAGVILTLVFGAGTIYFGKIIVPKQNAVIAANQSYIKNDYVACIDSLSGLTVDEMDQSTKYILAVSYAKSESLKQDEISSIVEKLSADSNEKELDYWIYLGRMELQPAEDMALALSDDKLLIYAYMKEADMLESNTSMDGTEKKERLDTLEQEIKKIGEKYTTDISGDAEETKETKSQETEEKEGE